jgi:hypothetical protein
MRRTPGKQARPDALGGAKAALRADLERDATGEEAEPASRYVVRRLAVIAKARLMANSRLALAGWNPSRGPPDWPGVEVG